jgi:hypothetical protein
MKVANAFELAASRSNLLRDTWTCNQPSIASLQVSNKRTDWGVKQSGQNEQLTSPDACSTLLKAVYALLRYCESVRHSRGSKSPLSPQFAQPFTY